MKKLEYSSYTRPQRLCKQCGLCCTMAVFQYSQEDLDKFFERNDEEIDDFMDVFTPYKTLDKPRELAPEYVDIVVNEMKSQGIYDENRPVFMKCKHALDGGKCAIYQNRFGWCKRTPRHAWTLMPVGCGFKGWQFGLQEQIKHGVRQLKEILYEYEILYGENGFIPSKNMTVKELKDKIMQKILPYKRFGSLYW
ncbi:MAG: YkgJ family cysteine cluster protein [Candidatus Gastranaerophilales bacterium]|nr:YkgJ family cysteine cluster protein [Candidatus Gastranaerophilales bacterium]